MPNWCENRVHITCNDKEIIKKFREELCTNDVMDFYKIKPLGLGVDEKGIPNWNYDVAVQKWGTKWALDTTEGSPDAGDFTNTDIGFGFETAWSPPEGIYISLVEWFDNQEVDYYISWFYDEPGMQFAGYLNNE